MRVWPQVVPQSIRTRPSRPNLSPWERSLAQNGPFRVTWDESDKRRTFYDKEKRRAGEPQNARIVIPKV